MPKEPEPLINFLTYGATSFLRERYQCLPRRAEAISARLVGALARARASARRGLPKVVPRALVRRDLGDTGGPIEVQVEYRFGSGRR
jgi:hypothetical protein